MLLFFKKIGVKGYYLKSILGENIDKPVKQENEPGKLYYCEGKKGNCKLVEEIKVGYYKNSDTNYKDTVQYIKCSSYNDNCYAVSVTNNDCESAKAGNLIVNKTANTDKFSICVNDSNGIELSETSDKWFVSINDNDTFGSKVTNGYILIDIIYDEDEGVHCFKNGKFFINIYMYIFFFCLNTNKYSKF